MSTTVKAAFSRVWSLLVRAARELNRTLAEPDHLESDPVSRDRDESVFQPREY